MKPIFFVFVYISFVGVTTWSRAEESASIAPAEPTFDVWEIRVEGNKALPTVLVERVVYPFLGARKSAKDIDGAREALEQVYRDQGYPTVMVDVPEQEVTHGVVQLRVTEGKIARVNVLGSRFHSLSYTRELTPALREGTVLYLPEFQQQMSALARVPDQQVTPVLRAGKRPGTVDVDLRVDDRLPLHASVEYNNRSSVNTSPTRLQAMVRYDNLWQRGNSLSLQYQTAPKDTREMQLWIASYALPLPGSDHMLSVYGVSSRSNVAALGDTNVVGRGEIYGLRYIVPLTPAEKFYHSLTLGADYKDFHESIVVAGADSLNTPIRYSPLSALYNATWQQSQGLTRFNAGLTFSMRGLSDKTIDCVGVPVNEFECKRYKARADFMYFKGGIQHTQRLPARWEVSAAFDVQLTDQALISNEGYGAGGAESVRGYLESERLGDRGWRGSFEVHVPSLSWSAASINSVYPLVFADAARLWVVDPLPSQIDHFNLLSVGAGIRLLALSRHFNVNLDGALPYFDGSVTRAKKPRFSGRISYEY